MDFGAQVGVYRSPAGRTTQPGDPELRWDRHLRPVVEQMDRGRWNSLWFADHFVPPPGPREHEPLPAFEGMTAITAAAAITENLTLGHLVIGNTYRNPGLVAKMAGSINDISQGRFVLGIGAGWFEREHDAYGWDFPSMRERQDRLQEACDLLRQLFRGAGPVDFQGEFYSLKEAPLSPNRFEGVPIPILVGGTGEKRTLRTLAMHGDVFNLDGWAGAGMSVELYQHKISVLEAHCENVGRDPSEIRRTILAPSLLTDDQAAADAFIERIGPNSFAGSADYLTQRIGEFIDAGVDEVMFASLRVEPEVYESFAAEVLSAFD